MGQYFYSTRTNDPYLARFAQADTIVPGGVQGYDRYAYVNNSPILYTDPCGHAVIEDNDENGNPVIDLTRPPTKLDRSGLTKISPTGVGGDQLYDTYLALWKQRAGWWWQAFGKDWNFGIWDFISMTSYYEASGLTQYGSLMAESGVRWYYGGVCPKSTSCGTIEGKLNWWAAYSQSAAGIYDLVIKQNETPEQFVGTNPGDMSIFGDSLRNPPDEWRSGWAYDRPYGWANTSWGIFSKNAETMFRSHPEALFVSYDSWVILSGCAWLNWEKNQNQAYCPSIH